jgi:hypothetical protein
MSHLMQVLETLKKHKLLANLKKCDFSQQCLVYLGYVISGGELKIDLAKMEAIMKWLVLTNFIEVRSFFLGNTIFAEVRSFIFNGSCTTPCHNSEW